MFHLLNPSFLITILLTMCTATSAQDTARFQNPFWAFDTMRESWQNQKDMRETQRQLEADSLYVQPEARDFYGQALMTVCLFNGDIKGKNRIEKAFREEKKILKQSESCLPSFHAVDARHFIVEKAANETILMVNEAHLYPQHRAFMRSLLPELYRLGYRHLFMEALSEEVDKPCPDRLMGIYIGEPVMGDLVRTAIRLGFRLHPYDGYMSANRDSASAQTILDLHNSFPAEKSIVFCGFDHNNEQSKRSVAHYLKELGNIDPLTVDQTVYSEPETSGYYRELVNYYHIDTPSVLVDEAGNAVKLNQTNRDLFIISPNTRFRNGYLVWYAEGTPCEWIANQRNDYDHVEVFYEEEINTQKHPIPFSIKQRNTESTPDSLLVPTGSPYRVVYSEGK